jgi:hypothetical protein
MCGTLCLAGDRGGGFCAAAVANRTDYKKSKTEKGNSLDFGLRFLRKFIFAMPKRL